MVNIVSPGTQVVTADESFSVGAGQGTVPMLVVATRANKATPDGTGVARGTTSSASGRLFLVNSQRELLQTFGLPQFKTVGGSAVNGDPTSEYGLLAAHSFLGISNRALILRADVDLGDLDPQTQPPTGPVADGTYWTDLSTLVPGLFVSTDSGINSWQPANVQIFQGGIVAGEVEPSSGFVEGDVVLTTDVRVLTVAQTQANYDGVGNNGSFDGGTGYGVGEVITLSNGSQITVVSETSGEVTAFTIDSPGTTVATGDVLVQSSTSSGGTDFALTVGSNNISRRGFGFFVKDGSNQWQPLQGTVAPFNNVPTATAAGEYWFKTTSIGQGASLEVKLFDGELGRFIDAGNVLFFEDSSAYYANVTPADQVATGTLAAFVDDDPLGFDVFWHNGQQTVSALAQDGINVGAGTDVTINGTVVTLDVTVTTVNAAVNLINTAGLPNVVAFNQNERLEIVNTAGQDLTISVSGNPSGIPVGVFSNWIPLGTAASEYEVGFEQPVGGPQDGVLWYDPGFRVDLLVRGASGWEEVPGEIIVSVSAPTQRPDGSALQVDDIWVSTADLDNYPQVYRRTTTEWVLADNSDQTTPLGIVFADYRSMPGAPASSDAPLFQAFPQGVLLWNTRYSSRNVKQWSSQDGVWKSVSGLNPDGSLITGTAAVRSLIVSRMAQEININQEIRSDVFYNLTAAPGFPELAPELSALSVDRKQTVFVIADTPFDLEPTSNSIQEWNSSFPDFPVASENVAVYYPSGLTRNLDGTEVVVPASHMVLRTFAFNDQVAYPWFAPAGFQRGIVNNARSVGYVRNGEFVSVNLNSGQRDVLYLNLINPITTFPGQGIVIMGQKTRLPVESALDRVNVSRLINFVRLQAEQLAEPFLFQPNDSQTRLAVRDRYESFLSTLVTLRGLTDFLVVCDESNNTPDRIDRNELWVDIAIAPTRAVEFVLIPIRIRNTGADLSL